MKIRILCALLAPLFLFAMSSGCKFEGGSVLTWPGESSSGEGEVDDGDDPEPDDPPDDTPVEEAIDLCRAAEVLPNDVDLVALLRNISDYNADELSNVFDRNNALWQAMIQAPQDAEGEIYKPTTATFAGIAEEVFEVMLRQMSATTPGAGDGMGMNDINCMALALTSYDNELLSFEPGENILQHIALKLGIADLVGGDQGEEATLAHLTFAWDDKPPNVVGMLRLFERIVFSRIPTGEGSLEYVPITADVADELFGDSNSVLIGNEYMECFALVYQPPEEGEAQLNSESVLPDFAENPEEGRGDDEARPVFQLMCQHDMDASGRFTFGVMMVTEESIAAMEQMAENALAWMTSTNKVTLNEYSFRYGSPLYFNLVEAMMTLPDFDPVMLIVADGAGLRKNLPLEIQERFSLFKTTPDYVNMGFSVSLDEQAKAAIAFQFQENPDGIPGGFKDMMFSGNVDLDGMATIINPGMSISYQVGEEIRSLGLSTIAEKLVMFADIMAE